MTNNYYQKHKERLRKEKRKNFTEEEKEKRCNKNISEK